MRVVITQPNERTSGAGDFARMTRLIEMAGFAGTAGDVIVLPELIGAGLSSADYKAAVAAMAKHFNCHVVGGSHFADVDGAMTNQGVVVDAEGETVAVFEKANPYLAERGISAGRGNGGTSFRVHGVSCFVTICADFFHAETFNRLSERADVIFVAASSVSRKPKPDLARARWKHAMIARAFEQTAHVAVSDWAYPVGGQERLPASGVAGMAYPDAAEPEDLIETLGDEQVKIFTVDVETGRKLYDDQQARGFAIAGERLLNA